MLVFCFVHQRSYDEAVIECSLRHNRKMSRETVADYYMYCREVCVAGIESLLDVEGKIGGVNHQVQIDETKFGKRKYQRGRLVEGTWIFGMIDCETNEFRVQICKENKRDEKTLNDMILKYVEIGTTIVSDMWAGYKNLDQYGYNHMTVNHSENFVDPITGANTQKIEASWNILKKRLGRGGVRKSAMSLHLSEYMYQKHLRKEGGDPFLLFFKKIIEMYGI